MKFEILAIGELVPDFFSRKIQNYLGTNYSHIAVLIDGAIVYHSIERGVVRELIQNALGPNDVIRHRFEFPIQPGREGFIMGWLEGSVGAKYAWSQYLGVFCPWIRFLVRNGKGQSFCSEYGATAVRDALGIYSPELEESDWITPKDIVEFCQRHRP